MTDEVTSSNTLVMALMAVGTLAIFCLLFWSMFADAKTAGCVTKVRLFGSDTVKVHDVRWMPTNGCEYFVSVGNADKAWLPERMVMRTQSER